MTEITWIFADGRECRSETEPVRLALYRDADSPADGLELEFAGTALLQESPCGVRIQKDGTLIFEGIVDTHTVDAQRGMRTETLVCRSLAARLLDNEAAPGLLNRPSVRVMEKLFLQPFGLRVSDNGTRAAAGRLSVERGTRCWTVLCRFAERFLHTGVYCTRGGAVVFGQRPQKEITLTEILRIRTVHNPYARISCAVVQNARTGAFDAVYENNAAAGVQRVRYFSSETASLAGKEIADGEKAAFSAEVTCTGYVDAGPGDTVRLPDAEEALQVVGVRFVRSAEKEETTLSLARCTDGKENKNVEFQTN